MALEYESICMFADHRLAAGASEGDVRNLRNSIFGMIVPVEVQYQWRPPLPDASGEMVLETEVERMAAADGTSMNQFLVMAAPEKLSAIQTAEAYFSALRSQGDRAAALAFLSRDGGEMPRSGDEILKAD